MFTALVSLFVAYLGRDAYELLETAYEVGLVGLVVPLLMGVHTQLGDERAAVASMTTGILVWLGHLGAGWEAFLEPWLADFLWLPPAPVCAVFGLGAYLTASLSPAAVRPEAVG